MKNISELVLFQVDCVDLYQIHGPIHLRSIEVVGNALAEAVKLGLTKTVGVSNYSTDEMIKMYDCLQKHGIQLASNQVEYSLLRRLPETSGHIAECHKRGVAVLGYCPLVSDVNKLIKTYFY
jgi:diketogulonate reductase-like aldo/keto reductase